MSFDVTPYIQAKSDQLNADDLVGGPITVQIESVGKGSADQPVKIEISGGHRPWKPCKTTLRVLVAAWGKDAAQWVGRWVTLYCDPSVKWGGREVGGIRIQALSHIPRALNLSLAVTRGKKAPQRVAVIDPSAIPANQSLDEILQDAGLTRDDLDQWLQSKGKPPTTEATNQQLESLTKWLRSDTSRLGQIANTKQEGEE